MAVITFDLAVETAIKAVIGCLDQAKTPSDNFNGIWQQVDGCLEKEGLQPLPNKATTFKIRNLRNAAQHEARPPSEIEVSDCRTYARDFLQQVMADIWGLSLDDISLADLVQHQGIREQLIRSEAALNKGDFKAAVEEASEALTMALMGVEPAIVGRRPINAHLDQKLMVMDSTMVAKPDEVLYDSLMKMRTTLLFLALNMDYESYLRYKGIAGEVVFALDSVSHHLKMSRLIDQSDAEFVVSFCVDCVAQIEERVGRLDAPYGSKTWYLR